MDHKLFYQNRNFLLSVLIIFIELLIFSMYLEKGDVVIGMNSYRTPLGNLIASYLTMISEGWVFILAIVLLLFYSFASSLAMMTMSLIVLVTSYMLKLLFHHPRPYTYLFEIDKWNNVQGYDPETIMWSYSSFPSGHTLAAFSLALFFSLIFPKYKFVLILLATVVAITRIYLVHHFFEDVVFGGLCGVLIGMLGVFVYFRIQNSYNHLSKSISLKSFKSNN